MPLGTSLGLADGRFVGFELDILLGSIDGLFVGRELRKEVGSEVGM